VILSIADRGKWLLLDRRRFLRVVFGVTAALFLLLTTSRGAVAVAAGSMLVLLCLGKSQRLPAVFLIILLMLTIPIILDTRRGVYLEEWFARTVSADRTWTQVSSGRSDQWMLFPRLFSDSPFWGYGPGLGRAQYAKYSSLDAWVEYRPNEEADWHSLYLQLGVEAGLIGLCSLALIILPLLFCCMKHLHATGEIVPLLGLVGFLIVAASVSAMDAISGVFLGLAFLSTKAARLPSQNEAGADLRPRIFLLTRSRAKRYLDGLMAVDATTMGERWGPEQWLLDLPEKWELSWVLLRAHEPICLLIASRKESALHIHRLVTAVNERDSGFGSQLLQTAARRARAKGCTSITLKVNLANEGAIRFYQRLGFNIVSASAKNLTMVAACQEVVELSRANKKSGLSDSWRG
jgi:ribosomal protein S18 acetylase RimI-like enzyme